MGQLNAINQLFPRREMDPQRESAQVYGVDSEPQAGSRLLGGQNYAVEACSSCSFISLAKSRATNIAALGRLRLDLDLLGA